MAKQEGVGSRSRAGDNPIGHNRVVYPGGEKLHMEEQKKNGILYVLLAVSIVIIVYELIRWLI